MRDPEASPVQLLWASAWGWMDCPATGQEVSTTDSEQVPRLRTCGSLAPDWQVLSVPPGDSKEQLGGHPLLEVSISRPVCSLRAQGRRRTKFLQCPPSVPALPLLLPLVKGRVPPPH